MRFCSMFALLKPTALTSKAVCAGFAGMLCSLPAVPVLRAEQALPATASCPGLLAGGALPAKAGAEPRLSAAASLQSYYRKRLLASNYAQDDKQVREPYCRFVALNYKSSDFLDDVTHSYCQKTPQHSQLIINVYDSYGSEAIDVLKVYYDLQQRLHAKILAYCDSYDYSDDMYQAIGEVYKFDEILKIFHSSNFSHIELKPDDSLEMVLNFKLRLQLDCEGNGMRLECFKARQKLHYKNFSARALGKALVSEDNKHCQQPQHIGKPQPRKNAGSFVMLAATRGGGNKIQLYVDEACAKQDLLIYSRYELIYFPQFLLPYAQQEFSYLKNSSHYYCRRLELLEFDYAKMAKRYNLPDEQPLGWKYTAESDPLQLQQLADGSYHKQLQVNLSISYAKHPPRKFTLLLGENGEFQLHPANMPASSPVPVE